jgi:hypothetical protein
VFLWCQAVQARHREPVHVPHCIHQGRG